MDTLRFMREHRDYFEDFVTRSTYHSNAIEGSTLSYAETYAILWNDNSLEVKATARELYEAINHKYALATAMNEGTGQLTEALIKRIAHDVNRNINELDGYRRTGVLIRGAEHLPPAANQVNQLMMQLVYEYNHDDETSPFLREARFHIRFERIHPFEDGNGRTGRILINQGLMKDGFPPIVIPFERRAEYMDLLARGDADGLAEIFRGLSEEERRRIEYFSDLD
ncbi:Fic family protein [Adlercreutzia sp. ZJ242]|uniref:Fic family protein n=1 Tax=Adlercreutzia sp. ZJ242 TaxID=2709409 RepID=UPI0013EAE8A2|nr:Fic family protein [Adlercreutzia sp. ZJ242]